MDTNELVEIITGGSILLVLFILALIIAYLVLYTIGMWKLFKKAGKHGWEAIIPYYSTYVLIQIAGLNWWYFLITLIGPIITLIGLDNLSFLTTIAGYVINFFVFWNLAKKMHKPTVSTAILGTIFSEIMILILGFSKEYQYDDSVAVSPNGPIGDDNNTSSNEPERFCLGCGKKLKPNTLFCENCGKKVE